MFDEETGLYYLRSRCYNPRRGRFGNADAEIAVEAKLWDAKLFLYCADNPVCYADDGGNSFWNVLAAAGGEIISGAAAANAAMTTAVAAEATGASLMFASRLGKEFEDGNYSNHTKLNNKSENEKI